jgi:hypothetical protein
MIRQKLEHTTYIRSYRVTVRLRSNTTEGLASAIAAVSRSLPSSEVLGSSPGFDHDFAFTVNKRRQAAVYKDNELVGPRRRHDQALELLISQVRITIAEFAHDRVFVHAGAVGWRGRAIIIPAVSFSGKTTLTAELVKCGALYYSDEYAVLDKRARVHPFLKDLSMRGIIDDRQQVEIPVENLGGRPGKRPIPVGLVLFTEYKPGSRWRPKVINAGAGVMELINNTVPIRRDPKFALPILSKVATDALIVKTKRGEAKDVARLVLDLLDQSRG